MIRRSSIYSIGALAATLSLVATSADAGGTPATGATTDQLITVIGSASDTADGDWVSAFTDPGGDGLDTYHSFFVEVPDGASRLVIDLFDMDILFEIDDNHVMGVDPAEQIAERDRIRAYDSYLDDTVGNASDRVFYTFATYTLFDPSDTAVVSRRIHGSHFAPSDGDNAWVTFYDSATTFDSGTFDTWADDFSGGTYAENDGTQNFATDWIESQETGVNSSAGPGAGLLRILSGQLQVRDLGDFSPDTGREPGIERELDLTGYVAARMSFDYTVSNQIEDDDTLAIEMSDDGGATWTTIDDLSGEELTYSGSLQYDISEFISSQTRVRFRIENLFAGSAEDVLFDNFEIRAQTATPAAPDPGHWEVRVDVSTGALRAATVASSRNGDETNAFGLRAHDGTSGAGGDEYNVYTHLYTAGINPNDDGRDYELYGLMTAGCSFASNDFDWDADLANNPGGPTSPFGSVDLTSPDGTVTASNTLSDNNMWSSTSIGSFTSDDEADQYGIWDIEIRIEDPEEGNYGPLYLADYDDAGPPPTNADFPDSDSFRIYLPTDAGGAPAKPYMTQALTFVDQQPFGGSNPPAETETTRYVVTVNVVNPAGSIGDITFDPTRVVTMYLPGGNITYQGQALVTQGSVVSEPTLGSNTAGDVEWNPGTVAAGSTAVFSYFIDVTGPAPPYTIDVNGIPGTGDGTRATWLDETGVADFSTRELCNLEVLNSGVTPVVVSDFSASRVDGTPVIEWRTASEAATLAFEVERLEGGTFMPLRQRPVAALLDQPQGGVYRLVDPGAGGQDAIYRLREHTSSGAEILYGPFTVSFDHGAGEVPAGGFDKTPHPPSASHLARLERAGRELEMAAAGSGIGAGGSATRLKIGVEVTGIQRLDAGVLAAAFDADPAEVLSDLRRGRFALSRGDEPVAWTASATGDGLEFYGQSLDTPYTGRNVYWLERAPGLVMPRQRQRTTPADWSGESFPETLWIERNVRPVVILELDPESDNWFWALLRVGDPAAGFDLEVPDPAGSGEATLTLHLQGAADGEHLFEVRWNGSSIGEAGVSGRQATTVQLSLGGTALLDGTNSVELLGLAGDFVAVDGFTLSYERRALALEDRLEMPAMAGRAASAGGFSAPDIRVFDLAEPGKPRLVRPRVLDDGGSFRAVWPQIGHAGPFHVTTRAGMTTPSLVVDQPSDLRHTGHQEDYLVIAAPTLVEVSANLADWRRRQGLDPLVISLEDVYDEFAGGVADPHAISDFLAYAHAHWQSPPSYTVLVGHGTYDFRDWYGLGGNLLPPLLWSRGDSLFPTDSRFGDLDGDGVPQIAVGRIPALTAAEMQAYIEKVIAYETAGDTEWDHQLALAADRADGAGDFGSEARALAEIPANGFAIREIFLDEHPNLGSARQLLLEQLDNGLGHLHYVGHGGIDRLSSSGLFTSADAAGLANGGRPTLLTAASCTIGLHALPGLDSLAELMVLHPAGGAVAAFAPAWISESPRAGMLADRLFRQLYLDTDTLGNAVRRAFEGAAAADIPIELLYTYQLIGDPALVLQLRPAPAVPTCTEDCGSG